MIEKSKEKQYREMFFAEAYEAHEELDKLFTVLEKNPEDKGSIESIFRITHTVKGNAMALGLDPIGELCHTLEEMFTYIKDHDMKLDKEFFGLIFRANDKFGELIDTLKKNGEATYKGLVAKLELYLDKHFRTLESNNVNSEPPNSSTNNESSQELEPSDTEPDNESESNQPKINFSDQVQIPVRKLDGLLNLVGELIIEKDTIIARDQNRNSNMYKRLNRITSDMQYAVMDIRLVQVGLLFNKFHRIARDVAEAENKQVNLQLEGTEIEIDRNILKIISDSLVHLVRNAISHGIENPEERVGLGKPQIGTVTLNACNEKDIVLIEIKDDGKGIDPEAIRNKALERGMISEEYASTLSDKEVIQLIFESGFSNADQVTEISGRGVGMDVVKKATESIGGQVNIETVLGEGTTFTLSLPSSMAVKGALLFEQDSQEFAVPLSFTEAVISIRPKEIHKVNKGLMADYLGQTMLIVFLKDLFEMEGLDSFHDNGSLHKTFDSLKANDENINVIIVNYNGRYMGLAVDKLLQQKEIVEKPLTQPLDKVDLFSGATILGNGMVCLVLNIASVIEKLFSERRSVQLSQSMMN